MRRNEDVERDQKKQKCKERTNRKKDLKKTKKEDVEKHSKKQE